MLVRMLRHLHKLKSYGPLEKGEDYTIDDDTANWLIDKGYAHMVAAGGEKPPEVENSPKEPSPSGAKVEINPDYAGWLQDHAFVRHPDGNSYSRVEKENGKIVKMVVDFKHNPNGNRYGYVLDEESGEWRDDKAVRDCQLLMDFKQFRDNLARVQTPPLPEGVQRYTPPKKRNREIVSEGGNGQEALLVMEAKDNEQIMAEMRGDLASEVLKEYFYSFQSGGRTVTGLSYAGVREIIRRMGHIEIKDDSLSYKKTKDGKWIAQCKGRDKARDIEIYGVAIQPEEMRLRSGGTRFDEFALTKAVAKAQRNAFRGLIPEAVVTKTYEEWRKQRAGM